MKPPRQYEPRSPYDPEDREEDDLWFLPGDPEDMAPTDPPWPMAERSAPSDRDWQKAEAACGRALAEAVAVFVRYDERLRLNPGAEQRIALMAASGALEAQGDWVATEKIALYAALREGAVAQARELSLADWAQRRMLGRLDPLDDLNAYLGRHNSDHDGFMEFDLFDEPARGQEFAETGGVWIRQQRALADAHPFTQAAAGFHDWRRLAISGADNLVDPIVVSAAIAAKAGRYARSVPASLGPRQNLLAAGDARARLDGWLQAVTEGCIRAVLELDRVERWHQKALAETGDLSGKTPPLIIATLLGQGITSTDMLAEATGASKAGIRRNMAAFERRGLVREVTGQGRYRFWTIR